MSEEETDFAISEKLDPLGDGISSLELVRLSGGDREIVNAARVSYGKSTDNVTERDEKLIRYLIQHDHTSPLEHNQLSFRVKAPVFVTRQWMRHRVNSFNEISYRYVKAPLEFYVPPVWRKQDTQNRQGSADEFTDEALLAEYRRALSTTAEIYERLLEGGVSRELARGLLPLCTYTQMIYTCNLHAMMHFMKLRLHPGAQFEIQAFAAGLLKLAEPHFPVTLREWRARHPEIESSVQERMVRWTRPRAC